jgi:hypothetical protein
VTRRVAAAVAVALVATACGAPPPGARAGGAAGSSPSPPPVRLAWMAGDEFGASIEQEVRQTIALDGASGPPAATDLSVSAQQTVTVRSVRDGVADLEVRVTSFHWGRSGAPQPAEVLPPPARVAVGPDGAIRSGRYWAMPLDPPLPGVDFFSSGLPAAAGTSAWSATWARILEDDTSLAYRATGVRIDAAANRVTLETTATAHVVRHGTTPGGLADLVQGDARAVVRSAFDPVRGRVLSTSYTTTFTSRDAQPRGTLRIDGTVVTSIRFSY